MSYRYQVLKQLTNFYRSGQPKNFNWDRDQDPLCPLPTHFNPEPSPKQAQKALLYDEGIRDSLGRTRIVPRLDQALDYLTTVYEFGIRHTTACMFAGVNTINHQFSFDLLKQMKVKIPKMRPILGIPTLPAALEWGIKCHQLNPAVIVGIFRGTSPLRMYAEGWTVEQIIADIKNSFQQAAAHKIPIYGVVEHATQTQPWFLKQLIQVMDESGGDYFQGIIITDTAGVAGPLGTQRLFSFVHQCLKELKIQQRVTLIMHNHNDRGLAVSNSLIALANHAAMVSVTPWGDGERAGNASLEGIVANLELIMHAENLAPRWQPTLLRQISLAYSQMIGEPAPEIGPLAENAFKTCFGTHLAAEYKMEQSIMELTQAIKDLEDMKSTIHAPWNPQTWGQTSHIIVSANTGLKGIKLKALKEYNLKISDQTAQKIYEFSCQKPEPLTDDEFQQFL